jgi:DNA-binding beta-propeller fold protein YncE
MAVLMSFSIAHAGDDSPVWPAPPAKPRIEYELSFSAPKDLGIKKGLFRRIGEIFTGSEPVQLVRPMAVLEDDGVIYVADPGAKAVHRFDTNRGRHHLIERENRMPLPSPVGLARDNSGKLYITDSMLGAVFVLKRRGKFAEPLKLDTVLTQPTGIAVNPDNGDLYIVDTSAHQVLVFNKKGKLVRRIGNRGKADTRFNYPTMLWRDADGELLVTDSLNFRIQRLAADGQHISSFGKLGNATGFLSRPKGVASDINGNIFVIDAMFHAVQIFDSIGNLLLHIGARGHGAGEFWLPAGIYIGDDQKIYIADSHNQRVQVFRPVEDSAL